MRGRRRAQQEAAIIAGWWATKIRADVENGKDVCLADYFDELLSDEERFERSINRMFERLDQKVAGSVH